jgi:SAM-dependent methyltransferase
MRLYNDLAHLWPVVSPPEEYAVEAALWLDIIRRHHSESGGQPGQKPRLLELGCGGGHLLSHLTQHVDAEAVDIAPKMLETSRRLNPLTLHHLGDMRTVRLDRSFDIVAIHDAVNYMLTEDDLKAAIATAALHLVPGGLLIMAPDCLRETFSGPRVIDWTRQNGNQDVTFIEYVADPDPNDTVIESVFIFIINRDGKISVEQDRHTSGLFYKQTWLDLLDESGFDAKYQETEAYEGGIGGHLFVGALRP